MNRVRHINLDLFEPRIDKKGRKHCVNCDALVTGRRRKYCSDKCTHDFYTKHDWVALRMKIIEESNYTCKKCGFHLEVINSAWECTTKDDDRFRDRYRWGDSQFIGDHIIPITLGGKEFDESNLQVLCKPCNKEKTARDMTAIAISRVRRKKPLVVDIDFRSFWGTVNRKTLDDFAFYGGNTQ